MKIFWSAESFLRSKWILFLSTSRHSDQNLAFLQPVNIIHILAPMIYSRCRSLTKMLMLPFKLISSILSSCNVLLCEISDFLEISKLLIQHQEGYLVGKCGGRSPSFGWSIYHYMHKMHGHLRLLIYYQQQCLRVWQHDRMNSVVNCRMMNTKWYVENE